MPAVKSSLTGRNMEPAVVVARAGELESAIKMLQKDLETSPSTHAEVRKRLAKDLREASDDLRKKTVECNALRVKVNELEKELGTLYDVPNLSDKEIQGFESQVILDAKAFAHLALLAKNHRFNCLHVTAEMASCGSA